MKSLLQLKRLRVYTSSQMASCASAPARCFVCSAFSPERVEEVANRQPGPLTSILSCLCVGELWQPADLRPAWWCSRLADQRPTCCESHTNPPFDSPHCSSHAECMFHSQAKWFACTGTICPPPPSWALAAYCPGLLLGERCVGGRQMVRQRS